jgi:putative Holliday junction resolvase
LDVGLRRVGVAVTDPLGLTAQPVETIARKPHGLFLERLAALAAKFGAAKIVLGLPVRTDGSIGPEAQRILALAHEIRTRLGLETDTYDERLTTAMAWRALDESGVKAAGRQRVIDQAAAAIILTGYLAKNSAAMASGAAGPAEAAAER